MTRSDMDITLKLSPSSWLNSMLISFPERDPLGNPCQTIRFTDGTSMEFSHIRHIMAKGMDEEPYYLVGHLCADEDIPSLKNPLDDCVLKSFSACEDGKSRLMTDVQEYIDRLRLVPA